MINWEEVSDEEFENERIRRAKAREIKQSITLLNYSECGSKPVLSFKVFSPKEGGGGLYWTVRDEYGKQYIAATLLRDKELKRLYNWLGLHLRDFP